MKRRRLMPNYLSLLPELLLKTLLIPLLTVRDIGRLKQTQKGLPDYFVGYTIHDEHSFLSGFTQDCMKHKILMPTLHMPGGDLNQLPSYVTSLRVWGSITGSLPLSIKRLGYHQYSAVSMGFFPSSLTELTFGSMFNKPIPLGLLPEGLKSLTLGHSFNQSLPRGVLPNSLTSLEVGYCFKKEICLPPGLTRYVSSGTESIDVFPSTLTYLHLDTQIQLKKGLFPEGLLTLKLPTHSTKLGITHNLESGVFPSSLTELELGSYFQAQLQPGDLSVNLLKLSMKVPQSLSLIAANDQNILPPSLTFLSLDFYTYLGSISAGALPESLLELQIDGAFVGLLYSGNIPRNLIRLDLYCDFDQQFQPGDLPETLQELRLHHRYNQPFLPGSLPLLLKLLGIENFRFQQKFEVGDLPDGLEALHLHADYSLLLNTEALPKNIKALSIGHFAERKKGVSISPVYRHRFKLLSELDDFPNLQASATKSPHPK